MMKKSLFIILISMLFLGCNSDDDNSIIENNCDFTSEIISDEDFKAIDISNYAIIKVELNNDCLEISFSSSGCGTERWEESLFSKDSFYNMLPLHRTLKMELLNEDICHAVFQKTVSFDLTPFQLEGHNKLALNIEGWNEQIMYKY